MKASYPSFLILTPIFGGVAVALGCSMLVAAPVSVSPLAGKVTAVCEKRGTDITKTADGVRLHTNFQKLSGIVTREGLQVVSTGDGAGTLQLKATAIGRDGSVSLQLPVTGRVSIGENTVSFTRSGLIEEYSTSVDGVRQDFVVATSPYGEGPLILNLALTGARASSAHQGVELTLEGSGRELAYNRLHVVDAAGRTLTATMEVIANDRIAVRVDDTNAGYPIRIDPTFSDADWVSLNPSMPGANGTVLASAVDGSGNIYIGGEFSAVGTVPASHVAMWNGTAWTPLGSGLNGAAKALVAKGDQIYVGGQFTTAGGVAVSNIAMWNGTAWSSLGAGTSGDVRALAAVGDDIFVAGGFKTAGGVTVNNIAKWDGLAWSEVGSGTNSMVLSLAAVGSDLYVAGGSAMGGLLKWNGSVLSTLDDGIGNIGSIYSLAADGDDLYVGGDFAFYVDKHLSPIPDESIEYPIARNIAKWDGSAWSILGEGISGVVHQVATGGGKVYVSGSFPTAGGLPAANIARWNGSTWSALGSGLPASARTLTVSGNHLYAGGAFRTAGGVTADFIAKWDSSVWSPMGTGTDGEIRAVATSGSDLYVGGSFTTIAGVSANRIAKWNGSAWSPLGSGMNHHVHALQVIGSNLYAGGRFTTAGGVSANRIAKWNGSRWSPLGLGVDSIVDTMAAMGTELYTVGNFQSVHPMVSYYTVAKWDGINWIPLGSGMDNVVSALAVSGSSLYAAGFFNYASGVQANHIAKWDGQSWSPLGSGMNSQVYALAVNGGDLFAGGAFSTAGGVPANNVAKWDGSRWATLGSGITGAYPTYVLALATNGTALYAGGEFDAADGVAGFNNLAEWTGDSWLPIGSGVNGRVSALSVSDSSRLYVGGTFTLAGTTLSPYIVQTDNLLATPLFRVWAGKTLLTDGSGPRTMLGSVSLGKSLIETFTVINDSHSNLTLAPITIDGANSAEFIVGTPNRTIVPPGWTTTFPVTFTPKTLGNKVASIHLLGTGVGDIPFDILLGGTGTPIPTFPEIAVVQPTGSNLVDGRTKRSFGTVKIGNTGNSKTFTIKNTGTAPLTGITVRKKGNHQKDFTLTPPARNHLAPGASVTFKVHFKPRARKDRNASIHIHSNDSDENPFDIKLVGFGSGHR